MFKFGGIFSGHEQKGAETILTTDSEREPARSEQLSSLACGDFSSQAEEIELVQQEHSPCVELEGELLELWNVWKENEPPPLLALADARSPGALLMDPETLEMERVRIKLKLLKHARLRTKLLQSAQTQEQPASISPLCLCMKSKNRHMAWLFVFPGVGDAPCLKEESVRSVLAKEAVTSGIDPAAIQLALDPADHFSLLPCAVGTAPIEGKDGSIIEHFPREVENKVILNEDDTADYRAQSYVQVVHENELICDIIPPVSGENGINVDGTPSKPKQVHAARVPKGPGLKFSDDGLHLLTARAGYLEYVHDCFQVQPVLDIAGDVDYSTGNVNFPGNVHVRGNIREGFQVIAAGSLMVDGLVEGAEVEVGSDLIITHGVVGNNAATLACGGILRAKFLENCTVYSRKAIFADSIITSKVCSDESITVTSGHGSIIGGAIVAGTTVQAKILGARSGRETVLILGERPYLEQVLLEIDQQVAENEEKQDQIKKKRFQILHLDRSLTPTERKERLSKLNDAMKPLEEAHASLLQSRQEYESPDIDLNACSVQSASIYPNTRISIGPDLWVIDTEQTSFQAKYPKEEPSAPADLPMSAPSI